MAKHSAGFLVYRRRGVEFEVLLVHPGGPFWRGKDHGVWSIPKGEHEPGEDAFTAALREFEEETGFRVEARGAHPLGKVRLNSGKIISAWAFEGDFDTASMRSNHFSMEWPPRSGRMQSFPEVDRAAWFPLPAAAEKLHPAQRGFLDQLIKLPDLRLNS